MEAIDYVKLFKLDQENYDFKGKSLFPNWVKSF